MARAPAFSRSGFTGPLGKLDDDPIKPFKVPVGVKEALSVQAHEIGLPFHEYLRELLTQVAFGRDAMKDAYSARADAIAKYVARTGKE